MARRRNSNRRRRRGSFGFLYKMLSVLVICTAIIAALTLFFRVNAIQVSGQQRYTDEHHANRCYYHSIFPNYRVHKNTHLFQVNNCRYSLSILLVH